MKTTSGTAINAISDIYKTVEQASRANNTISSSVNTKNVDVIDNRYTSKDNFVTGVTGHKLVYKLATPQTVQLDPVEIKTLLGSNEINCDTGDSSVTYRADIAKYIDKKLNP